MEAFAAEAGVSSVLGESLQAEVLQRGHPRHACDVGHQHILTHDKNAWPTFLEYTPKSAKQKTKTNQHTYTHTHTQL